MPTTVDLGLDPPPATDPPPTTDPATTAPSTTGTPTTTVPPTIDAVSTALAASSLDGESVSLAELLGPYVGGTPMLVIGDRRAALGEPRQLVMYSSPDGAPWAEVEGASLGSGDDTDVTAATWTGNRLAVGGDLPAADGARQPRVWFTTDLTTFGEPEDPFGGLPGTVTAFAASIEGLVVLGQVYESATPTTRIALRDDVTGVWSVTSLPPEANATGLTTNGGTVVATGSTTVGQLQQAAAWASIDGGRTFSAADTSAFAGGVSTAIGAVVGYPAGFVGAACVGDGDGATTAVATSNDGYTWQRVALNVVYANEDGRPYPNRSGTCTHISFGNDRFYISGFDIDGVLLAIGHDGVGEALRFPLDVGTLATGEPQAALGPNGWAAVVPQGRGLFAVTESPPTYLAPAAGLPEPERSVSPPALRRAMSGITAGVPTYPEIEANDDGSFTWGPRTEWFQSADGGAWSSSDFLNGIDASGVVSNGTTSVAWSSVDDPGDDDRPGPVGGTAVWVQDADGATREVGVVAGGLGGQTITDIEPVPTGYVAVGSSSVRNLDTGFTPTQPIVHVAPPDGLAWSQETPPVPAGDAQIDSACVLGDGTLLGLGQAVVGGAATMYLLRRAADATWSTVDPAQFPAGIVAFDSCAASSSGALLVTTLDRQTRAFFTADGVTFEEADLASVVGDDAPVTFTSYAGGFVAVGESSADADRDIVVWYSRDGVAWRRHDVAGLGGPGHQFAGDVIVVGTRLVIAGLTDDAPVVWAAPLP